MTRQDFIYLVIVAITLFVVWYLLGGTGAPFSAYVRWSSFVLVCQGGIFAGHRLSGLQEE